MAVITMQMGIGVVPRVVFRGDGRFAGLAPDPAVSGSPDGRFRVLNVPARGRITVHERSTMICVAETLSAADGTWTVDFLDRDIDYYVIGWDDTGAQNAAVQDWVTPAPME